MQPPPCAAVDIVSPAARWWDDDTRIAVLRDRVDPRTTDAVVRPRPPRRPSGWRAPGPAPSPPPDASLLGPREGEDLCHLSGDWRIFQRLDGHRWSLDDLATAWVAAAECRATPPARICDLGCGIGSVLLMMAWSFPAAQLVGVEAQETSVDLARRSAAWNGAGGRCEIRLGDLRDPAVLPERGGFDLVTGTPPYLPPGTARPSARPQWAPCHFELRGGIGDYIEAAARVLAGDGVFVACAAGRDDARVGRGAAAVGLAIHRRVEVIPRQGKPALFAVYALRRVRDGGTALAESTLVIRDREGRRTSECVAMRAAMGLPP